MQKPFGRAAVKRARSRSTPASTEPPLLGVWVFQNSRVRPGVAEEQPRLAAAVLDISLLTGTERAALFQAADTRPGLRHLTMV